MATILDTDILSEIFKERDSKVLSRALDYLNKNDSLVFTSVSVRELLYGLYAKNATRQIVSAKRFLESHEELIPTSQDYRLAAEIDAALHRSANQ